MEFIYIPFLLENTRKIQHSKPLMPGLEAAVQDLCSMCAIYCMYLCMSNRRGKVCAINRQLLGKIKRQEKRKGSLILLSMKEPEGGVQLCFEGVLGG